MLTHMRTTIDLPDPLLKRVKEAADKRGITMRRLIEEALRRYLAEPKPQRFKLRDASFKGQGLVPGMDWGDFDRMREAAYEGRGP
jgi:hypothetical protein